MAEDWWKNSILEPGERLNEQTLRDALVVMAEYKQQPYVEIVSPGEYNDRLDSGWTGPGAWTGVDSDRYYRIKWKRYLVEKWTALGKWPR